MKDKLICALKNNAIKIELYDQSCYRGHYVLRTGVKNGNIGLFIRGVFRKEKKELFKRNWLGLYKKYYTTVNVKTDDEYCIRFNSEVYVIDKETYDEILNIRKTEKEKILIEQLNKMCNDEQ